MSTRSPQNERNTNPDAKPGYMRKSAASAKPARSAAGSVRVVPASAKEKRKQAERGESLARKIRTRGYADNSFGNRYTKRTECDRECFGEGAGGNFYTAFGTFDG